MAVSPDRRFLYVVMRSQPYGVACYAIDSESGRLAHLGVGPLADSMAYLAVDGSGRFPPRGVLSGPQGLGQRHRGPTASSVRPRK